MKTKKKKILKTLRTSKLSRKELTQQARLWRSWIRKHAEQMHPHKPAPKTDVEYMEYAQWLYHKGQTDFIEHFFNLDKTKTKNKKEGKTDDDRNDNK